MRYFTTCPRHFILVPLLLIFTWVQVSTTNLELRPCQSTRNSSTTHAKFNATFDRNYYSWSINSTELHDNKTILCLEDTIRSEDVKMEQAVNSSVVDSGPELKNTSSILWRHLMNDSLKEDCINGYDDNDQDDSKILPCLPLCCLPDTRIRNNTCHTVSQPNFEFPVLHDPVTKNSIGVKVDDGKFRFYLYDPCNGTRRYKLDPTEMIEDTYVVLANGSIYLTEINQVLHHMNYCFGVTDGNVYDVVVCFGEGIPDYEQGGYENMQEEEMGITYPVGMIISVPFLLMTFLVYTLIPELRNMHGLTLRCYVGSLLVGYSFLVSVCLTPQMMISDDLCIGMAFIIHFSFLASFFWLNVMCFDIWWTFGGFRALRGSVKQRERKKFIMYSIYAWGSAALLTGVCIIMDFVPSVPDDFIKPDFGKERCWFHTDKAKAVYFYGPMGVTVLCNICLFISTAMKIVQHKKDTAHHLKGSESRRHDDNKQWFNLYLKLFIVMGISWSMEIISWLFEKNTPDSAWYITDIANTLQGLIIFIIFVWKDKIKRLLLKRFGCQGPNVLSRNSTRSAYLSSTSRTCTTSVPLQEKINPSIHETYRAKVISEESDCA